MRTLPVSLVGLWLLVSSSGCAALSLFGETHTHHHAAPEGLETRLHSLEERVSQLEQQQYRPTSAVQPVSATQPVSMPDVWAEPSEPGL